MPYDMSEDQGHCPYPRMSDLESVTEQEDISLGRFPSPKGLIMTESPQRINEFINCFFTSNALVKLD